MMTLSTINGDAGYYGGAENYEIIHDDQGKWFGNGAETLGLRGDITPATLDAILRGHLPDGSRLTRLKDGAESNRPGIDLTFGAPKSVSILGLMGGDTRLVDAFRESVTETLTQLEKTVNTRVTENGEVSLRFLLGIGAENKFSTDTLSEKYPSSPLDCISHGRQERTFSGKFPEKVSFYFSLTTLLSLSNKPSIRSISSLRRKA